MTRLETIALSKAYARSGGLNLDAFWALFKDYHEMALELQGEHQGQPYKLPDLDEVRFDEQEVAPPPVVAPRIDVAIRPLSAAPAESLEDLYSRVASLAPQHLDIELDGVANPVRVLVVPYQNQNTQMAGLEFLSEDRIPISKTGYSLGQKIDIQKDVADFRSSMNQLYRRRSSPVPISVPPPPRDHMDGGMFAGNIT